MVVVIGGVPGVREGVPLDRARYLLHARLCFVYGQARERHLFGRLWEGHRSGGRAGGDVGASHGLDFFRVRKSV